jgi:hypothetical protein
LALAAAFGAALVGTAHRARAQQADGVQGTNLAKATATGSAEAGSALVADQPLSVSITSANPVTIMTVALPSTRLEAPYSTTLVASGGSGLYRWSLSSGSLPSGLSLDATTGTITGTAAASGRFTFTVRATDVGDPVNASDQTLTLGVLAALPPAMYQAISDRIARAKGPVPELGTAGYAFVDAQFGSRIIRVTDGATRPAAPDRSYRTPSGSHTNAWSADARYFYTTSTDGTLIPFAFDGTTMTARRLDPAATGNGGAILRFFGEPIFSYVTPGVMYGTYSGPGANLRSVDAHDIETGVYTPILNLDTLAPELAGTYAGGVGVSGGAAEQIFAFFGGASQGRHFYLVVFEKDNPSNRRLVDTLASTVDGMPTNITLDFRIHAAAIDRSGRYVTIYPTATDQQPPRSAAPAYLWDIVANRFTATPLAEARAGGHDAYGYGYRINQDCCTSSTWDAAQWQFRSLATPLTSTDLISPVLQPKEIYLADHPSWHNAQPDSLVPFIDANYRYYDTTSVEWRAWDEEVFAVQTDAPGSGAIVWRFAHHRSLASDDLDPTRFYFWYTPRANVSPDGRWALFTSNWDKTLGVDPGGQVGGSYRQDVFLVELKRSDAQPEPEPTAPIEITSTSLPDGRRGAFYSATLSVAGGRAPLTWSIAAGTLPTGLALDAATGIIAGTPGGNGKWTFAVRVVDSASPATADSQTLSIKIRGR